MITTALYILGAMMVSSSILVLCACIGAGRASQMEESACEEYGYEYATDKYTKPVMSPVAGD